MQSLVQWALSRSNATSLRGAQIASPYLLAGALVAVYVVAALLLPSGTFFSQDSDAKFLQTQALAASAWRSDGIADPARALEPSGALSPLRPSFAGHFFYERGGEWHSKYSLPFALLASIPYGLFGLRGLVLISALPALLTLVFALQAARLLGMSRPWLAVLLLGVCTPLPFYAVEFWEHAFGLALAMIALLCAIREDPLRPANVLLAALAIGVGAWFRTELICLAPALGLALLGPLRRDAFRAVPLFCAALAAGLLPLLAVNWLYTGTLFGPQLGAELQVETRSQGLWVAMQSQATVAWLMLGPSRFKTGWLILLPLALLATLVTWRMRGRTTTGRVSVFLIVASTCCALLWGLRSTSIYNYPIDFVSAGGGVVLAFLYLLYRPDDEEARTRASRLAILGAVFAGLVLMTSPHFGGQQWGPRYLLPIYPILVLLGALGLEGLLAATKSRGRTWLLGASRLLVLLSIGVSIQSIGYVLAWRELHGSTVAQLEALPPSIIVTDIHVLPFTVATIIDRHVLLGVENGEQVRQVSALLAAQGQFDLVWVSTNRPFPHNWQQEPVPADLYRELEALGWSVTTTRAVDHGGYIYTHYHLAP